MADKIVTLTTFYDAMEAEIVRGRLEANDIACFIADGGFIGANPLYNQAAGGIKIKVFEDDLEKCRKILSEKIEVEGETDVCPVCESPDIYYGPVELSKNWFYLAFYLLLSVLPLYINRTWYCKNCGNKFSKPKIINSPSTQPE